MYIYQLIENLRFHMWLSPLVNLFYVIWQRLISSTFYIVQLLVQSHFELVSSILALDATETVSQPVTQMAVEMINIHLISVQPKCNCNCNNHNKQILKWCWNDVWTVMKQCHLVDKFCIFINLLILRQIYFCKIFQLYNLLISNS